MCFLSHTYYFSWNVYYFNSQIPRWSNSQQRRMGISKAQFKSTTTSKVLSIFLLAFCKSPPNFEDSFFWLATWGWVNGKMTQLKGGLTIFLDHLILRLEHHVQASRCGGLPSSMSGSAPAIIYTLCCRLWHGISYKCVCVFIVMTLYQQLHISYFNHLLCFFETPTSSMTRHLCGTGQKD